MKYFILALLSLGLRSRLNFEKKEDFSQKDEDVEDYSKGENIDIVYTFDSVGEDVVRDKLSPILK